MLNIVHTYYPVISIEANPSFDYDLEVDASGLNVSVDFKKDQSEEQEHYIVMVRVNLDMDESVDIPYNVEILGMGKFFVESEDEIFRKAIAGRNGASVLYAGIREMVATVTARSVHGPFTLPTYYFKNEQFLSDAEDKHLRKVLKNMVK